MGRMPLVIMCDVMTNSTIYGGVKTSKSIEALAVHIFSYDLKFIDPLSIEPFESLDTEGVYHFLYLTFEVEDLHDIT